MKGGGRAAAGGLIGALGVTVFGACDNSYSRQQLRGGSGFCYNYCVRPEYIAPYCMIVSFAYFSALSLGGCYATANCDQCVG